MKIYRIKHLIDGYKVGFPGKTFVCCPSAKGFTHINYENQLMRLSGPIHTLSSQDKFGRGVYFLDYYEWIPASAENLWSAV